MFLLYSFGVLLLLILLRAFSLNRQSIIERQIEIHKPVSEVYDYVKLLRNHKLFNKWTMTDPNLEIVYKGEDGTVGFDSYWKSAVKNVGEGHQTIRGMQNGERIDYDLIFIKPFAGTAKAYVVTSEKNVNGLPTTLVTWGFASERNFMAKIMQTLLNLERMLGKDLSISLQNLKKNLETN